MAGAGWPLRRYAVTPTRRQCAHKGIPMKQIRALLLGVLSAAGVAQAWAATPISGRWKVHTNMVKESDQVCTLTQKGTKLHGTCVGDNGTVKISGTVDGTKVSWSYKTQYGSAPLTVSYAGNLKSTKKIVGFTSVPEFGLQGDFTAVKAAN